MHKHFSGKTVVITGGAGGLAAALIEQLLATGANIAALDLHIEGLLANKQLLPLQVDITDNSALSAAVTQVIETFGAIDVLINNAGITHMSTFEQLGAQTFNTIMAVNFTASVELTRMCLPYLLKTKGQIVAISSVAGYAPLYGRSAYSASKHAMEGFFLSLESELSDVSVTVVCPSFVKSRPELTAQVNSGISSPGAMKKQTNGEQIAPNIAAEKILKATAKKQRKLYLGKVAKIAYWLNALVPSIYLKLMTKSAKQEFT
ncbi:SDR family oxidoreductase [Thalassotalea sp. G2M2-11]|uniref:SDR family oxidoreductase n=1 Tax=Thalassotalea sp. G2M2-11 TaxID=2787627 RepID=UPI0019D05488|nr:SDR family oxidoreductase [Thalassotalea sp. G2M2-11]